MKPNPIWLAGAAVLALSATLATPAEAKPKPATPATSPLNFDSLPGGSTAVGVLPANSTTGGTYGGFTWTNWVSVRGDNVANSYFSNSPDTWVTATDNLNSIYRATSFVFDGAWFSGPAKTPNPTNPQYGMPVSNQLQYQLWLGNALVFTGSAFVPNSQFSTWQASGYTGAVDTVVVHANVANYFAMDDFSFSAYTAPVAPPISPTSPVPEPATLALLMGGLGVVLSARFRAAGPAGR